jgi:hypothetical protein
MGLLAAVVTPLVVAGTLGSEILALLLEFVCSLLTACKRNIASATDKNCRVLRFFFIADSNPS